MKSFLVKTPLYRPLLELRSRREFAKVQSAELGSFATGYCISPFKTGTTYISEHFGNFQQTAHEPLQYTTLKNLENVDFLKRRASYLNVALESSGFFAGRMSLLRQFAPNAPTLSIYRDFESWVTSFLSYFSDLSDSLSYNYIARHIFDPICHAPIDQFFSLDKQTQDSVILGLFEYWCNAYEDALADPQTRFVNIKEIDANLNSIAEFLNLENGQLSDRAWTRSNKKKRHIEVSSILNDYALRAEKIGAACADRKV